jgi:uracil-DNA glycosylase family 4
MPADADDWRVRLTGLTAQVVACRACTMRAECSGPVPGNIEQGNRPHIMIVGRNPGAAEDREGRGFVGAAGRRLNQLLAGRGQDDREVHGRLVDRTTSWVTNVAKCFTAANRPPEPAEWQTCAGQWLRGEVRIIQPLLILSFGAEAMHALTGHSDSIMQRSGTTITGAESNGVIQYAVLDGGERRWDPVIPVDCTIVLLPHPAAALRTRAAELKLQQAGRVVEQWLQEHGNT